MLSTKLLLMKISSSIGRKNRWPLHQIIVLVESDWLGCSNGTSTTV